MKLKRTTLRGIRWEDQVLDEVEKHIYDEKTNPDGKFKDFSQAVRELSKMGSRLLDFQNMMKDPEKALEFQRKMQEIVETEKIFEWTPTLSDTQLRGFLMALLMEKDARYANKKLL